MNLKKSLRNYHNEIYYQNTMSCYSTFEGKGIVQFKKDYQKYILKKYEFKKKLN